MKGFRVTIDELKAELDQGKEIFFIDSRNKPDWEASEIQIKGAVRIPNDELADRLDEIPRNRTVITY